MLFLQSSWCSSCCLFWRPAQDTTKQAKFTNDSAEQGAAIAYDSLMHKVTEREEMYACLNEQVTSVEISLTSNVNTERTVDCAWATITSESDHTSKVTPS